MLSFFLFYVASSDIFNGIMYNWDGQTKDTKIYIETSNGKFYFVDFITGEIFWSIETGGDVCTSATYGKTTFIPSIDGYLFTYSQNSGFQRLALSIRELVFTAPFKTRSGEIFSSGKKTTIFEVDPEKGTIINIQASDSTTPASKKNVSNVNTTKIIRIDFDLNIFNGDSQLVRYSDFEVFPKETTSKELYNVNIETQLAGQATIKVNNTLQTNISLPEVITGVYGSGSKFRYQMISNEDGKVSDSSVMFLTDKSLAIPARAHLQKTKTNETHFKIKNSTQEAMEEYTRGIHNVNEDFEECQKIESLPNDSTENNETQQQQPQQNTNENNGQTQSQQQTLNAQSYYLISPSNFIIFAACLILVYLCIRIVFSLVSRLMNVEKKLDPIIVDKNDPTIGTSGGRKLTLVHRKTIRMKCLSLARSVGMLDNTAKFLKDEILENEVIIGYQQLDTFDFEHIDAVSFLRRMFGALSSIFSHGLVHGSISEDVIYSDGGQATLAGLEWSCSKSYSIEKTGKDIKDLASIVRRTYVHFNIPFDSLLLDLLSDMENDDPAERPTPEEALKHPLFFTIQEKAKVYYQANGELSSQSAPPSMIKEFEDNRIAVLQCTSWLPTLPKPLINDIKSRGDYGGDSMRDLVRLIRNKIEHVSETPQKLIPIIGSTSEEVFLYFNEKFPNLFLYTYYFVQKYCQ